MNTEPVEESSGLDSLIISIFSGGTGGSSAAPANQQRGGKEK
jgi:hypothetical protein